MDEWSELKKEFYKQENTLVITDWGLIDFSPDGMKSVLHGEHLSYDEYLDLQKESYGKCRHYFEMCYYDSMKEAFLKGELSKIDYKHRRVVFQRLAVVGDYSDGTCFEGKEDHVWMSRDGFEGYEPGDCLQFAATVQRYLKTKNGKIIDYGLVDPYMIQKIKPYHVPTNAELINQNIEKLICRVCMYAEQCNHQYCLMNAEERQKEIDFLKALLQSKKAQEI